MSSEPRANRECTKLLTRSSQLEMSRLPDLPTTQSAMTRSSDSPISTNLYLLAALKVFT
jgi:hypothetical protein